MESPDPRLAHHTAPVPPGDDSAVRLRALAPDASFIVQAPAGSGKTELLIQRHLRLLALVDSPEEVVAVTFTRKAAAEMRDRVARALATAEATPDPPAEPHRRHTWTLARAALERDAARGWRLTEHPARLRILTIDALSGWLVRQMPRLSGFGAAPDPADGARAAELHRDAARRTLALLESDAPRDRDAAAAAADLLRHLDNDTGRAEALLAELLATRDQWLRHTGAGLSRQDGAPADAALAEELRRALERGLAAAAWRGTLRLLRRFPRHLAEETAELARHAAANLEADGGDSATGLAAALRTIDPAIYQEDHESDLDYDNPIICDFIAESLEQARALSAFLLTKGDGGWRKPKGIDARLGFPAAGSGAGKDARKAWKDRMGLLVGALSDFDDRHDDGPGALHDALHATRMLPPMRYPDAQWRILSRLFSLLPRAAVELSAGFMERGEADFAELSTRALAALGPDDDPTDLALALDHRIAHLLVDEFQDTSVAQFHLIGRLVAGWEPGDGRTLFLVGDPMQSIYGFREAEVGLFLGVTATRALGPVDVEPLRLTRNFRSDPRVVDWFNRTFAGVLPDRDDPSEGAVSYHPSAAARALPETMDHGGDGESDGDESGGHGPRVFLHPRVGRDDLDEARAVADLAAAELDALPPAAPGAPPHRVAVLVRGRNHLAHILAEFRARGMRYQAVEIDALANRPAVRDLHALTRALLHPADRLAWLSVLRAPWCGLTGADLHCLASPDLGAPIPDLLARHAFDPTAFAMSADGRDRLNRTADVLLRALANRDRAPLRSWVTSVFVTLGGPATWREPADRADAEAYLAMLDTLPSLDLESLEARLAGLRAAPDPEADGRLVVMTAHRSKGLEFHTVIVPGMGKAGANDRRRLLTWAERADLPEGARVLMAPVEETGTAADPIYAYVQGLGKRRSEHEAGRVLYVTTTRARERLHLLGHVRPAKDGAFSANARSGFGQLWPAIGLEASNRLSEWGAGTTGEAVGVAEAPDGESDMESDTFLAAMAAGIAEPPPPSVRRFPEGFIIPAAPPDAPRPPAPWDAADGAFDPEMEGAAFPASPAGLRALRVGSALHRWLAVLSAAAARGAGRASIIPDIARLRPSIRESLAADGLAPDDLDAAADDVADGLATTLADGPADRPGAGAWWLAAPPASAVPGPGGPAGRPDPFTGDRVALTVMKAGRPETLRIDRVVRAADGTLWAVDYRSAHHQGGDLDEWLREKLLEARPALTAMGDALAEAAGIPRTRVRTGLYYVRHGEWLESSGRR